MSMKHIYSFTFIHKKKRGKTEILSFFFHRRFAGRFAHNIFILHPDNHIFLLRASAIFVQFQFHRAPRYGFEISVSSIIHEPIEKRFSYFAVIPLTVTSEKNSPSHGNITNEIFHHGTRSMARRLGLLEIPRMKYERQ